MPQGGDYHRILIRLMNKSVVSLLILVLLAGGLKAQEATGLAAYPRPKFLGPVDSYGQNIQRTMYLLDSSTPHHRNTVKILFYGQSITEQRWSKAVTADLKARFPNANLIVENRAIGGFASPLLVKTAEADLYPFYPDLLIFHVFGSEVEYENIVRRVRQRTTAEIILQTDHLSAADSLDEPVTSTTISLSRLSPWAGDLWAPWMNYVFLPSTAAKYQAELINQRGLWKRYLRDFQLKPSELLRDDVHLNDRGCFLMAEIMKAYLRYDPKYDNKNSAGWVQDFTVGRDVDWCDGKLTLNFIGNRVDVICGSGEAEPADVQIDGQFPSQFPSLYACTRTTYFPDSLWPCLLQVGSRAPLEVEDWTITLRDVAADMSQFRFDVVGSKTGPDGSGENDKPFVSDSGRVVIDPADWIFDYACNAYQRTVSDGFEIHWRVYPLFHDQFISPGIDDPAIETTVVLAQGLPNAEHQLEICGDARTPVKAIRVYRPMQ